MRPWILAVTLALFACAPSTRAQSAEAADGVTHGGIVVAAHPLAVEAGVEVLRAGGSAADAAVAVEAVLGLVEPQSSGLGGGAFMVYYDAESRTVEAYDGRETAPAGATPELFLDANGRPLGFLAAKNSGLSIGVPGAVDMLALAQREHGKLDWARLFEPALRDASDGFTVTPRMAASIAQSENYGLKDSPAALAYFFPDGEAVKAGDTLRNPAYAATLTAIAADPRALYEGPIADAIATAAQAGDNGGTLTAQDLGAYHARKLEPVCAPYHSYTVCGAALPSSGGIVVNEIMGVLSRFTFSDAGAADPKNWALFTEAQRLGYADWGQHLGDDRFVDVPIAGLLSPDYLADRAALISPDHPMADVAPGDPWAYQPDGPGAHYGADATDDRPGTSHFVIVDADGDVVSMTASVESAFGSTRMAGGMILNNELTDFSFFPVDRNGAPAANAVAPGKAPRSSMSPTIVLNADGSFHFATGSPGGASIIAYTAKTLIGVLDWGLTPQQAIDLPNVIARGNGVRVERARAPDGLVEGLEAYGYAVQESAGENSGLHSVLRREDGALEAGVDPRREGVAIVP